jgi:DNA/RNA-binding domain of Phe-tRNA-synthetase-like protein
MTELPDPWEAAPEPGWIEPALAEEFPGLSVASAALEATTGRSPEALKEQLRLLSDRIGGAQAIQLRQKPIPWAYRVFFRHIGLDPDTTRTPIEQLIFERMHDGRFRSRNRVEDALTIAMVEVGVALRAFDADRVKGRVGLRLSAEGEGFEGRVSPLPEGTIVVADEKRPLGILFDRTAEGREVGRGTGRVLLVAIGVRGVPDVAIEEALWVAGSALRA